MNTAADILFAILSAMLIFSGLFWIGVWMSVETLLSRRRQSTLAASETAARWPTVSILKPLKGRDPEAAANFASFCRQDYPGWFEIVFAVRDPADPAVAAVRLLQCSFPQMPISLRVAPALGANPKTALLHQMSLDAEGEIIVISDSDVRVGPGYLRRVVQPLRDQSEVGVVTCPYRVENAHGVVGRLESLGRAGFLVPAAIFAATVLGEPLGMGATIAVRARDLAASGGFAAFADHLADDNRLAKQIHSLGLAVHMSDEVVAIVSDGWCGSFRGLWDREVRWGRAERVSCGTLKYTGMLLTFTVALAMVSVGWGLIGSWPIWLAVAVCGAVGVRLATAWRVASLLGYQMDAFDLLLMLPRAILSPVIWTAALAGNDVRWRGRCFHLGRDGRLMPIPHQSVSPRRGLLNAITLRVDAALRRQRGIREFTQDPDCLLRISFDPAPYAVRLDDGATVAADDPVIEIHLWSERIRQIAATGPTLGWARELQSRFEKSLADLAIAVLNDPKLSDAVAVHGTGTLMARHGNAQVRRIAARMGFELHPDPRPQTFARRLHDFGENILVWMLTRAHNPHSLRKKIVLNRKRQQVWMSRDALLERYGPRTKVISPSRSSIVRPTPIKAQEKVVA